MVKMNKEKPASHSLACRFGLMSVICVGVLAQIALGVYQGAAGQCQIGFGFI